LGLFFFQFFFSARLRVIKYKKKGENTHQTVAMPRATAHTANTTLTQVIDHPTAARFKSSCLDSCMRDFLGAMRPLKNARKRDMPPSMRARLYIEMLQRALTNAEEVYASSLSREAAKKQRKKGGAQ
jgi:hypothetical protein